MICGSNSAVEFLLAKQVVAGSNPVSRSKVLKGDVAKWLRRRSAKPLFIGSNPIVASSFIKRRGGGIW